MIVVAMTGHRAILWALLPLASTAALCALNLGSEILDFLLPVTHNVFVQQLHPSILVIPFVVESPGGGGPVASQQRVSNVTSTNSTFLIA
jgi:hypothetical protein